MHTPHPILSERPILRYNIPVQEQETTMTHEISYSELRKDLKKYLDQVCTDHKPILVKRRNGGNVMLVEEHDYCGLDETAYLSSSPANMKRLLEALHRKDEKGLSLEEVREKLGI